MPVYVSPTTVVGGQVEHHVDTVDCRAGDTRLAQVRVHELETGGTVVDSEVGWIAAGEIVNDSDVSTPFDQGIDEVGTDERRSSSHEDTPLIPPVRHCTPPFSPRKPKPSNSRPLAPRLPPPLQAVAVAGSGMRVP